MKFSLAFVLAALSTSAFAITGFTGCADCAGFDHDEVFARCQTICLQDEHVEQKVKQGCQERCHRFVLDSGCCPTGICLGKGQVRRSYPPLSEAVSDVYDVFRDEVKDEVLPVETTEEAVDLGAEADLDERDLEKRDFSSCCASCTALAIASNRCPNSSLSMGLNMASLACKAACQYNYGSAYPCN